MSGGSFDYLYSKSCADLICDTEQLERMTECLKSLHYATKSYKHTREILEKVKRILELCSEVDEEVFIIYPVWKAVEWWKSGDSSESDVKSAMGRLEDGD